MTFLGIDPGALGAIAILDASGAILDVHDMPSVEVQVGRTLRNRVSPAGLRAMLTAHGDCTVCTIEQVGGITGQSASAAFTFGRACGLVEGVLAGLQMPVAPVTPQAWKKSAGIATDKGAAREAAMRIWPKDAHRFTRKKDNDRAEAALLARHGWLAVQRTAA